MNRDKEILSKIAYYSFYLAVIAEVLIVLVDKSAYTNPIEGRLFQITFLLFFIKTCLTKYSKKEYLTIALFLLLGAVSYFVTERNEIVRIVMFVAACKDIDMKKCLKMVFYMTLTGCVAIILLSIVGIGGAVSLTQDYGRGSVETRYTLGMGHPNALQCMVWALTVLGLYLYGEKLRWYSYLCLLAVNLFFFLLTDSKTGMLVALFSIFYAGIMRFVKSDKIKKYFSVAGLLATVESIVLSVVAAASAHHVYNYDWSIDRGQVPAFFKKLDLLLTGRMRTLTENDGWEGTIRTWSLFSEPDNIYYFDMGWVRLFYWYGIIPACIGIAALLIVTIYCIRKKKYAEIVMITAFSVYTLIEAHAVSVYIARNYVLFLIGALWTGVLLGDSRKEEN